MRDKRTFIGKGIWEGKGEPFTPRARKINKRVAKRCVRRDSVRIIRES